MNSHRALLLATASLAIAFLTGCLGTTPVKHTTASGRPEVTINRQVAKSALAEITNQMVNLAYVPRTRSETVAVFEKDLDRLETFLIKGAPREKKPVRRVTYDIVESEASTRILATLAIVSDPGGIDEKATPVNDSKESLQWQQLLDSIKAKYDGQQPRPPAQATQTQVSPATTPAPQRPAPEAPAQSSTRPAPLPPAEQMSVAEMQRHLADHGYQPGPADGIIGRRTIEALKKFQHDNGLPVTGKLDSDTAARLRKSK